MYLKSGKKKKKKIQRGIRECFFPTCSYLVWWWRLIDRTQTPLSHSTAPEDAWQMDESGILGSAINICHQATGKTDTENKQEKMTILLVGCAQPGHAITSVVFPRHFSCESKSALLSTSPPLIVMAVVHWLPFHHVPPSSYTFQHLSKTVKVQKLTGQAGSRGRSVPGPSLYVDKQLVAH